MDGQKVSALETIDVAKRMIASNDYLGARSKLLEIHYKFPSLGNLAEMMIACDILCASDLTLSEGDIDWYWVLQLSPAASASQIRLQHNKLSRMLDRIKGEFPGAVTAVKLVQDASFVLSNPPKRLVFDSKRLTSWGICEPSVSPVSSIDNSASCSGKGLIREPDLSLACESSISRNTDPTIGLKNIGEGCSTGIELDGPHSLPDDEVNHISDDGTTEAVDLDYLNNGVCSTEDTSVPLALKSIPNDKVHLCENPVMSTVDPGQSTHKSLPLLDATPGPRKDAGFYNANCSVEAKAFEVGQIWAAYDNENLPRRYARINSVSDSPFRLDVTWLRPVPETDNEAKWCEVGLPVGCGLFNLCGDDDTVVEHSIFSHSVSYTANPTYDEFRICPQEDDFWAIYKEWTPLEWFDNPESRKGCSLEVIQILSLKEEDGLIVAQPVKFDVYQNIYRSGTEEGQESFEIPLSCLYRFSHCLPSHELKNGDSASFSCEEPHTAKSLLKAEWTAEDFSAGQVWAIYSDPDQMPRQYVVVNYLVSNTIVSVKLLEPHPTREDEIGWVEENLQPGCGIFKAGTRIATLQMSVFSHLVNCDRSNRQMFYRIYPKKGEVWTMYRNWNSKWKKQDFVNSRCRIVQITSNFCEQSGVQVASLEEVPGYKTFFQKQLCDGFALNRTVQRSEMLSFSHRVESFVVPGIQAHGIPECSWHLEPDALPLVLSH